MSVQNKNTQNSGLSLDPAADSLLIAIASIVGPAGLIYDAHGMAPYLTDWRGIFKGAARCVVKPASTAELASVVALCDNHAAPIVPQGGLTSLCGGATPQPEGTEVVINLSRMNRIVDIDPLNNTMTVQAGCVLQHIKDAAETADRLFLHWHWVRREAVRLVATCRRMREA